MRTRVTPPPDDFVAIWMEQHQPEDMPDWVWVRFLCSLGTGILQKLSDESGIDVQDLILGSRSALNENINLN